MVRFLLLSLVVACAKVPYDRGGYGAGAMPAAERSGGYEADDYGPPAAMAAPKAAPGAPPARSMARESGAARPQTALGGEAEEAPSPQGPASEAPAQAGARMVHYQGFAQIKAGKTQEVVDGAIALATTAGGGLEQQYGNTVVLRVPVARFQEVFDAVLKLGDVVTKSIQAEDVTEAFTATELRLKTAQARRDRLVQLLAQSKDENEKLALVREIQAATEEIDRLDQQVRTLQRLADFSRITVQIDQRPALTWHGGAPESAAFAWIRALSPFSQDLAGKKLALDVPAGFVALDVKKRFVAESAEGARIWTVRLPNDPVGDTPFWTRALQERIGSEFAAAEEKTVGAWRGLRLVDRSETPYVWVVLVRAVGKDLDVVQIFYPSAGAEERHAPAVDAVLTVGGAA
jgi:hypothetical protein